MNQTVLEIARDQIKKQVPDFRPGDTVRVAVRIIEGDKERIQNFEGVCIARRGSGLDETFTVRRVSFGIGMERIFPLHSPRVESIKVIRQGHVRRSKLYYLRNLTGKKARLSETRRKRLAKGHLHDVGWAQFDEQTLEEPGTAEEAAEQAAEETEAPVAAAGAAEEKTEAAVETAEAPSSEEKAEAEKKES